MTGGHQGLAALVVDNPVPKHFEFRIKVCSPGPVHCRVLLLLPLSHLYRYKHIRDMVKAEEEMDAMAIADRDSRRLRDYHQALSTVGRIVLGYKGRNIAKERRREARLEEVRTVRCIPLHMKEPGVRPSGTYQVTYFVQTSASGYGVQDFREFTKKQAINVPPACPCFDVSTAVGRLGKIDPGEG